MMKKTPGPLAPPVSSRPSLKMTALSYSCKVIIMTGDRNPIYLIEDIEEAELRCLGGKIYYKICDKRNLSFMKWCVNLKPVLRRSDLDHFYDEDERDWERDEDEEERDDGHEESADPGPLLTSRLACNTFSLLCRITEAESPVLT